MRRDRAAAILASVAGGGTRSTAIREEGLNATARPQGGIPGGRTGYAHAAGDEGGAQGDADRRRPAADPLCNGGGKGGRHRAVLLYHRARQERDRGSFRCRLRTRGDTGGPRPQRVARRAEFLACSARGYRLYPAAAPIGAWSRRLVCPQSGRE